MTIINQNIINQINNILLKQEYTIFISLILGVWFSFESFVR